MKIDTHQHFWHYNSKEFGWIGEDDDVLKRDFLPPELLTELSVMAYTGSIAVQARQSLEETRWLLDLAAKFEHIRGVVGWIDLRSSNIEEDLKEFEHNKWLKGIRHLVQDEPDDDFMLRTDFQNGISKLAERNLVYEILIYERQLSVAAELIRKFPDQQFIVDHIAKPNIKEGEIRNWELGMRKLATFPNVNIKVSGMVTEADKKEWKAEDFDPYLGVVWREFGEDRILLGSDWPVCLGVASYYEVMSLSENFFKNYGQGVIEKVCATNAIRIYSL